MYVCHCRAVNDRTVRAAADAGVLTVDDLMQTCGVVVIAAAVTPCSRSCSRPDADARVTAGFPSSSVSLRSSEVQ